MSGSIIPISKSENKIIESLMKELRSSHRQIIEDRMMNNGFAKTEVINFDNETIIVRLTYGIQIAIPELVFDRIVKIDRHKMQVMEIVEA